MNAFPNQNSWHWLGPGEPLPFAQTLPGASPSLHRLLQFTRAWGHPPSNSQEELRHTEVPWLLLNQLSESSRAGRQTALPACQKARPTVVAQPHTTYKSPLTMVTVLNIRTETIKLLEKNIVANLCYLGFGFLDMIPKTQVTGGKNG